MIAAERLAFTCGPTGNECDEPGKACSHFLIDKIAAVGLSGATRCWAAARHERWFGMNGQAITSQMIA